MNNKVKRILIIVLIIASIGGIVLADTLLNANQVYYNANGTNTTVDAALQDLYSKATEAQACKTILQNAFDRTNITLFTSNLTAVVNSGKVIYGDLNGDGTPEGVIYADLSESKDTNWGGSDGTFKYTAISSTELKKYYISGHVDRATGEDTYGFGEGDVLAPIGGGKDRFYIMALTNLADGKYWYYSASGNMSDGVTDSGNGLVAFTSTEFGKGRENTMAMLRRWNAKGYGAKNDNDLWNVIQAKVNEGWFVPSSGEWGAFGENLNITEDRDGSGSNYLSKNLPMFAWSSSQSTTSYAWYPYFVGGCMYDGKVTNNRAVRLSATF